MVDLNRGWVRHQLIFDLAVGKLTPTQLGRKYHVPKAQIEKFRKRWEYEIEFQRENVESAFVGMWITEKRNRLAELQQTIDDINREIQTRTRLSAQLEEVLDDPDEYPEEIVRFARRMMAERSAGGTTIDGLMRTKGKLLRDVSELLGDLKQDIGINVSGVRHELIGVNTEDLT